MLQLAKDPPYTHSESVSSQPRQEPSYIRHEYNHGPYSAGYGFYQTGGHGQNENI